MNIFTEISIILIITAGIATVMRLLRQPLVVGYMLSGVIIGPYVLNLLHATHELELFSKVGIAILLFIVGLSLNPDMVKETGKPALVGGIGQIVATSVIGFFIIKWLGYSNIVAMYGSVALTLSSTIIVMKLLSDRGDLNSLYGRVSIGFLLVQDVVATILLIILPLIGAQSAVGTHVGMEFLRLFASGVALSIGLYLIAKYILPKFSDYLAKSSELLFIFSVSWGLVLATVFYEVGFSIEIGALIAGVTLSASKYSFEISSRMRPLRDFFVLMFFVLLGSQLVFENIGVLVIPAIVLSAFVLIGKPIIVFFILNRLGYTSRTSFMAGLTIAQISEFSLILMALGFSLGHIDQEVVTLITLVGIVTIIGSTYFITYSDMLYARMRGFLRMVSAPRSNEKKSVESEKVAEMIIFGFGRVGLEFVEKAKEKKLSHLVVDFNPEVFLGDRAEGVNHQFGDIEDIEFLDEIKAADARIIVSTIPDLDSNLLLVRYYRGLNSDGILLVTSHSVDDAQKLYAAGATYVILPHYLGAYHATQMIGEYQTNPNTFTDQRELQNKQIARYLKYTNQR